eukprot:CAMPEP_0204418598 /NCGR_PEP_ID=MMETSP0470-20130426/29973_1 /ASSEMBLY_ACC=CAM_ASM_000385 /TAXON_ID=2969 /ORGANISM="Oxyrrhis marina" /LENGTH=39 /DNA_ID= /DNA_START= /DNA_END= /DNA_ORIENTATION=
MTAANVAKNGKKLQAGRAKFTKAPPAALSRSTKLVNCTK